MKIVFNKKNIIFLILLFNIILSFINLGNFEEFPHNGIKLSNEIIVKLENSIFENPDNIFFGIYSNEIYGTPEISYSTDNIHYNKYNVSLGDLLGDFYIINIDKDSKIKYIKIRCNKNYWNIEELYFFSVGKEKNLIDYKIFEEGKDYVLNGITNKEKEKLNDEVNYIFKNNKIYKLNIDKSSNYHKFDETIYKLNALEVLNKTPYFENTHPPTGKYLIALGVFLFGYNFIGIRIMSIFFNIFLIFLIYKFIFILTNDYKTSNIGAIIFSSDCMRYVISRLCTIGNFDVFFITLSLYFIYKLYISKNEKLTKNDFLNMIYSGIFIGISISVKWTSFYCFIIIFIVYLLKFRDIKDKQKYIFYGLLCFIIIPIIIYFLSYIFFIPLNKDIYIKNMINNQLTMLNHHVLYADKTVFSSKPFLWMFNKGKMELINSKSGIVVLMCNPFISSLTIFEFIYSIYRIIKYKDKNNVFLLISCFCLYIPWFFVKRPLYIYHFYIIIPLLIIMIVYNFYTTNKNYLKIYMFLCICYFILNFNILNGFYYK